MADLERVGLIFKSDGDVDFVKSLRNINASLSENYQQLRLTQSQYDKNTSTAQKLQDRMVYLNGAYDSQKDKVTVLVKELEELEAAEKKDEVAINKKKASLAQAEAQLNTYGKNLDSVKGKIKENTAHLEDFRKKLDKVGEGFVGAGKKVSVLGAGIGAAMGMSVKSAMDFESAFAGVEKTVDGTEEQLQDLKKGIRDMALEIPASTTEISNVAEAAGQLGIKTKDVLNFTRVMIDMGESTNLTSDQAATTLAKFANVTKMSADDFSRLGSTIVSLGNNFATTEADIASMAMNLGAAGTQVGMSQSEIAAFATTLSSVGIEAQAGGSAFSKVMIQMQLATEVGGEKLKDFASVAGMSSKEFAKAFKEDASSAIMSFVEGLSKTGEQGESAIKVLDDMGIKEVRLRDSLLRSANASELFSEAIEVGSEAWRENIALTKEAETRYQTTESQLAMAKNTLNDIAITFGDLMLPAFNQFLDKLKSILNTIRELDPTLQKIVLGLGSFIVVLGPILIFIGKIATGVSSIIGLFIKLKPIILPILASIKASLASVAAALGLSIGWLVAIGVAIVALVVLIVKNWDKIKTYTIHLAKSIKETVGVLVESIKEVFGKISETVTKTLDDVKVFVKNLVDDIKNRFEAMKESVELVIENIKQFFVDSFNIIKDFVVRTFDKIKESLINFKDKALEVLDLPIQFVKNALLLLVALFAMFLETIYNKVILPLVEFFTSAFDTFKEKISDTLEKVKEMFQVVFDWIKSNVITPVKDFIINAFEVVKERLRSIMANIRQFISDSFKWVQTNVITPVVEFFQKSFDKIQEIIFKAIDKVKNFFKQSFDWIKNSVVAPLTDFFIGVFDNIVNTINSAISKVKNGFKTVVDFVKTSFTNVRTFIVDIFSTIGNVIKTPINGVIRLINNVLNSLNKIKVPSWVPGVGGSGINFPMIPMLAKGGELLNGQSIVAEAGPELLTQKGNKTIVTPLSDGGGAVKRELIDYKEMAKAMMYAMSGLKLVVDEDGIARIVDERLMQVV